MASLDAEEFRRWRTQADRALDTTLLAAGMHYTSADAEQAVADARTLLAAVDEAWAQVSGP